MCALLLQLIFIHPSYALRFKVSAQNLHLGCRVTDGELIRISEFTSCVPTSHMNASKFDTEYSDDLVERLQHNMSGGWWC